MGVPFFFSWLKRRYPNLVESFTIGKTKYTEFINPSSKTYDQMYLDLNGIIHQSTHAHSSAQTELEMKQVFYSEMDRVFNFGTPTSLLYIAIDGVAPRSKLNQQRARRYVAGKNRVETERVEGKGIFDSNCITPGTEFLDKVSSWVVDYVQEKIEMDSRWSQIKVVFSDGNMPGEGEHKIVEYIRGLKEDPEFDLDTSIALYGQDADLLFLGLALHLDNITIIRETERVKYIVEENPDFLDKDKIAISNLPLSITEEDIFSIFSEKEDHSDVEVSLHKSGKTQNLRITFTTEEQAMKWVEQETITFEENEHTIKHPRMKTQYSDELSKTVVFVKNLSFGVTELDLGNFFSDCGEVVQVRIITGDSGSSRGYGYVEFSSFDGMDNALEKDGQELMGRRIKVDETKVVIPDERDQRGEKITEFLASTPTFENRIAYQYLEKYDWDVQKSIQKYLNKDIDLSHDSVSSEEPFTLEDISENKEITYGVIYCHITHLKFYMEPEFNLVFKTLDDQDLDGTGENQTSTEPFEEYFEFDMDKVIDDFILLCFFAGNDFMPELWFLDIRQRAITFLLKAYKKNVVTTQRYIIEDGVINWQSILETLQNIEWIETSKSVLAGVYVERAETEDGEKVPWAEFAQQRLAKKKEILYQERYHQQYSLNTEFITPIAKKYIEAVEWVYNYYFNGCVSWSWYYPYHYGVAISDFCDVLSDMIEAGELTEPFSFEKSQPYSPVEQLISVLPPSSIELLPEPYQFLFKEDSPLAQYFPQDFKVDYYKAMQYDNVVLLEFIDENVLLPVVRKVGQDEYQPSEPIIWN